MWGWLLALGAAFAWRMWLGTHYAGWEESDYGNLAMIEGVRAGGFRHYDMNHMPGYYGLSALVHVVVGNALVAGRTVAMVGGLGAFAGGVWLAQRLGGRWAALLAAGWMLVQPELALYSATTLREPLYALALVGFVASLVERRPWVAGLFGALAFSVRFDAFVVLGAATLVHVWADRRAVSTAVRTMAPIVAGAVLWSVYCRIDHGTFAFWSHAVAVNVETGLGAESERPLDWVLAGTDVAARLVGWLLPWRIGWGVWLSAVVVLVVTPWRTPGPLRTLSATAFMATGFWAAVGFIGQHSPEHNLYWKWMMPLVPLLVPLGAVGWSMALRRAGDRKKVVLVILGLTVIQAFGSHLKETHRQVALSQELYAPQVDIARWIEAEVDVENTLLVDNIPACWLNRRPHERSLVSWFDVPVPPNNPEAFGAWLVDERIPWVLWFQEDWTQAPRFAPGLESGGVHRLGPAELVERSREDSYGWVLYEVRGEGIPVHSGAPPPTADLGRVHSTLAPPTNPH